MDPVSLLVGFLVGVVVTVVVMVIATVALLGGFLHFLSREEDLNADDDPADAFPSPSPALTPLTL